MDSCVSSRPTGGRSGEEIYRDAKIAEIYEGTNEIQRWIVAREIFGPDLVG
jgi:alkylation response protein AidB-like acyl-CoA dehydrogenase